MDYSDIKNKIIDHEDRIDELKRDRETIENKLEQSVIQNIEDLGSDVDIAIEEFNTIKTRIKDEILDLIDNTIKREQDNIYELESKLKDSDNDEY